jgi:hypothetical protein
MSIAQVYKSEQIVYDRIGEGALDFGWPEIVAIDVPADARSCEEFHIVNASEQADVIDLRDAWYEELHCSGDQVLISTASEGIVESAVDLIKVEIVGSCAGSSPTLTPTAGMNGFDKLFNLRRGKEAGFALSIASDINYADPVVRIEHSNAIVRANCQPTRERSGVACKKRM